MTESKTTLASETPDYCYDADNWDCTHSWDDQDFLTDDLPCGEVMEVALLKKLPSLFVTRVYNEAEDKYELKWFPTQEAASKAVPQALKEREI
jgi:hypothetical protein